MNTNEALRTLRAAAENIPQMGRRNQAINRLDRISLLLKKAGIDAGREFGYPVPLQQQTAIVDNYNTCKRILAALISGRKLSYKDMREFHTAEWHTRIHEVKDMVANKPEYQHYIFCSRWESDGKHPYKLYWLEETK